jgi:polysaccharide biosynthesis transport protein
MTTLANRTPTAAAAGATAEPIRLSALLHVLRRRGAFIGAFCVIGALLGLLYARTLPQQFTASSLIAVEGDRYAIPELQGALRADNIPDPMPVVRTEMQALVSPDLVRGVVEKLHLADLAEFNAELRAPSLLKSLRAEIFPSAAVPTPDEIEASVVNAVLRSLTIFQDNRSLAIQVSFTSEDPGRSAQVLNTLVSDYIAARAERRTAANREANGAMTQRIDQLRKEIADLEKRIQDTRDQNGLVLLRAGGVGQQQLEEMTTALAHASVERAELETTYNRAQELAKDGNSDALAGVLNSPTIGELRAQEASAMERVAQLSANHGSGYPPLASARAQLAAARGQLGGETERIISSIASQLSVARQREADLSKQLDDTRKVALQSENAQADLNQLQQEVASRRALYQTLLQNAQQTVDQPLAATTPDVHVITTATPPTAPSGPHVKLAGGLGGLGGLLLGGLLTLARVRSVDGFANPREFEAATGMAVLACLPQDTLRQGRRNLLERVRGETAEAKAMRDIRSRLRRMGRLKMPRIVMFSAATADDHAALLAMAIGRVAAAGGESVLAIDCDPQRQNLARVLNLKVRSDADDGDAGRDWRDLLVGDPDAPVDLLLPSSAMPRDWAQGMLFQNLIVEAPEDYDLVVLIGPEAGSADAVKLAQQADVSVLVLGPGAARGGERQLAERFAATSRGALGAVLFGKCALGKGDGAAS